MTVTGLIYFDGGALETEHSLQAEYNEIIIYQDSQLPGLGLVVQNCSRLASGYDIYATMVSRSGSVVFVNRAVDFTTRHGLDPDYPDDDPVFVLWWASGDVLIPGSYCLQFKAVDQAVVTGVEYFPVLSVEILSRLASGGV